MWRTSCARYLTGGRKCIGEAYRKALPLFATRESLMNESITQLQKASPTPLEPFEQPLPSQKVFARSSRFLP